MMDFPVCCVCATGVNGAGKTTQLQIITGALQPDSGSVIKEKPNMRIAYLTQEFDVLPTRTVRVSTCPDQIRAVCSYTILMLPDKRCSFSCAPVPAHIDCSSDCTAKVEVVARWI